MSDINLALNKKANASNYVKPYEPSRAVDGNSAPNVVYETDKVAVTATAEDKEAMIKINDGAAVSGQTQTVN